MPWDQQHVKTFEAQKSQKMALDTFRSGCYERAVAILQSSECTGTQQATAESLHRLLQAAGADSIRAELPEQDADFVYQEQLNAEAARQAKLMAKANKLQLRRERQQRRHEQSMALRQKRYDEKVKARQLEFTAQVLQRKSQQTSHLQHLVEQQQHLQEVLANHQQSSAELLSNAPSDSSKEALAAVQQELQDVQSRKARAEQQLRMVSHVLPILLPLVSLHDFDLNCALNLVLQHMDRVILHQSALPDKLTTGCCNTPLINIAYASTCFSACTWLRNCTHNCQKVTCKRSEPGCSSHT